MKMELRVAVSDLHTNTDGNAAFIMARKTYN
ncbi:Protein of unknown function [Bacillus cereus]|nr:Protein of unknown function [Bacillus cereus]